MKVTKFLKKTATRIGLKKIKDEFIRKKISKCQIIEIVKKENLSYLTEMELFNIHKQVINTNNFGGVIVEAGCALGGSAIVIANAKLADKRFYIFDVFDMIPPPSENDGQDVIDRYDIIKKGQSKGINDEIYYGYRKDLLDEVKNNFTKCGIKIDSSINFVKGLYQDTLLMTDPISFAHIDCDWYESVMICLKQIIPNLVIGGRVIIDDYNAWSGCKKAVDEFFSDKKQKNNYKLILREKLLIVRVN
jgi:asparagine synthase (glutamine-hydrolysing)